MPEGARRMASTIRRTMTILAFAWVVSIPSSAIAQPAQVSSTTSPIVDYTIHVTLDPKAKTLTGFETLLYRNASPDVIRVLQFHMYLNAFKNERSTFWLESGGALRDDKAPKDAWGYIDVTGLRVNGDDVLSRFIYVHPDDDNVNDKTVAQIRLPKALQPGETVQLDIDFEAKLPKLFARTGYRGDYFLVGQWFPKIGVWETAGHRRRETAGWNCHQFHAMSEFYANFGRYRVIITLPKEYVVGATGILKKETIEDDNITLVYEAQDVVDFAFTASPDFVREERLFDPAEWVSEAELDEVMALHEISREDASLYPVTMILLAYPEKRHLADRYFKALANAIKYFGLWYGPYPYPAITIVDPPWGASASGGMEYPTFITGWSHRNAPEDALGLLPGLAGPEMVTIHEFGHQYWQSMVASNEFEEAWLDEGINSYSTGAIMDRVYGPSAFYLDFNQIPIPAQPFLGLKPARGETLARLGPMLNRNTDAMDRASWQFLHPESYVLNSYLKPEAVLRQLQHEVGDDTMARIMRTYFQRWKFDHPAAQDFMGVAEELAGKDLSPFFDQFIFTTGFVDFAVAEVETTPMGYEKGIFGESGGRETRDKSFVKGLKKHDKDKDDATLPHRTVITVENRGNFTYPVDILITFADKQEIRVTWDGAYPWKRFVYEDRPPLESVIIDPDGKLLLDVNRANNSYVSNPDYLILGRWGARLFVAVQNILQVLAGAAS